MSYESIDLISHFLYGFRWVLIVLAVLLLILGLDDLFIDIAYWLRRAWRRLSVYRHNERADEQRLFSTPEKPLALMVPAWKEEGVVAPMARLTAANLDYENYQIFIGTYPNDPNTAREVDGICRQYNNIHKVVCARPGPTSKADCLNNIIEAALEFERQAGIEFAGFVLHDAEDIVAPLELRLFNYLLPRKDMIQVPVYPIPAHWYEFTAGHYVDEFAEQHGKEQVLREALIQQVPSAGVGTCFSRRAIVALLQESDGIAFDVRSLTEDYDIGLRLSRKGMTGIFAHYYVRNPDYAGMREQKRGVSRKLGQIIAVREHFPRTLSDAVRQKARWITGIVFQGTRNLGWDKSFGVNYFLWRDRRGGIANFIGLLVNIALLIIVILWLITLNFPDYALFPSLLGGNEMLGALLVANGVLLLNRLFQRAWFVTMYYGLWQGLWSAPRVLWSNLINFLANLRALRLVLRQGDSRRVSWDKTSHEFPRIEDMRRTPIGIRLVELGLVSEAELEQALLAGSGRRLGRELLVRNLIDSKDLARVLAEQSGLEWTVLNPFGLDPELVDYFPARLALRYSVLPLAEEGKTLVLASESALSPVVIGAISRQLGRPAACRIVPQGRVTVGLRYWYMPRKSDRLKGLLDDLYEHKDDEVLLEEVCKHQVLLGDIIQSRGMLPGTLFAQAIIDFEPEEQSLGEHLIERGLITEETLNKAITEQEAEEQAAYAAVGVAA